MGPRWGRTVYPQLTPFTNLVFPVIGADGCTAREGRHVKVNGQEISDGMGRGWQMPLGPGNEAALAPLWRLIGDSELSLVSRGLGRSTSPGGSARYDLREESGYAPEIAAGSAADPDVAVCGRDRRREGMALLRDYGSQRIHMLREPAQTTQGPSLGSSHPPRWRSAPSRGTLIPSTRTATALLVLLTLPTLVIDDFSASYAGFQTPESGSTSNRPTTYPEQATDPILGLRLSLCRAGVS